MLIRHLYDLNRTLLNGPYAWPGGYPLFYLAADGEPLSFEAVADNKPEVFAAFEEGGDPAWRPVACGINWEDESLYCAHTGRAIECAYPAEDEVAS